MYARYQDVNIIRSQLSPFIKDTESAILIALRSALTRRTMNAHAAGELTTSEKCDDGLFCWLKSKGLFLVTSVDNQKYGPCFILQGQFQEM